MSDSVPLPDQAVPPASPPFWRRAIKIGALLLVFLATHIGDAVGAFTKPPPGAGIVVPEAPIPDDDAFATLLKLAEPVDKALGKIQKDRRRQDKHCGGLATQKPLDGPCAEALVRETSDTLKAFDAWVAGAEQDMRTIVALGSFLQQNPILLSYMVGLSAHQIGLGALVTHLPADATAPELDGLLPASQPYIGDMKMALGAEWLGLREWIQNGFLGLTDDKAPGFVALVWSLPQPVAISLGQYSRAHTLRLFAGDIQPALQQLETGLLAGTASTDYWHQVCPTRNRDEWSWLSIFVRPNPVGHTLACAGDYGWDLYLSRTGQAMDRLAATHVILAARRFKQKEGRWPTTEKDIAPAYLPTWPTSALDGQPLRWLEDKSGILILGEDGKSPCEASQWCRLPFDPPAPVAPDAGEAKAQKPRKA